MKIRNADRREHIVLQMTPMIDIVFQLLVFFVFTFKIVLPEGDFNIRMPSAAATRTIEPSETPLLKVTLRAAENRELAQIRLNDIVFEGPAPFLQLQQQIRSMIGDAGGPGTAEQEVEIDSDYDLKYRYVINALTAITGYIDSNGDQHKLVEKVRFAPVEQQ